jgi:hypothetical protein
MRSRTSSSLVDVYFPCCSQPCQTNLYYSTTELSICLGHAAANSAAFKSLITSLCVSWKHWTLRPIQPHSSHLSQAFLARGSTVRCCQFSRIQVTYHKSLSLVEALFAAANSAAFKSLIASLCLSLKQCSRHRFSSLLRTRGTTPSISHMISPIVVVLVD